MVHKGNKSVASSSVQRQGTQTLGRQDGRAPARAYAMKAVEDTDAPYVIADNFPTHIFAPTYPTWVNYRGVKPSMTSW